MICSLYSTVVIGEPIPASVEVPNRGKGRWSSSAHVFPVATATPRQHA